LGTLKCDFYRLDVQSTMKVDYHTDTQLLWINMHSRLSLFSLFDFLSFDTDFGYYAQRKQAKLVMNYNIILNLLDYMKYLSQKYKVMLENLYTNNGC